jgi:hypothetical protein
VGKGELAAGSAAGCWAEKGALREEEDKSTEATQRGGFSFERPGLETFTFPISGWFFLAEGVC